MLTLPTNVSNFVLPIISLNPYVPPRLAFLFVESHHLYFFY